MTSGRRHVVELDPGPQAELDRLEKGGHLDLLDRLDDAIADLEDNPGSRRSRRRAFTNGTYGITVRSPSEDWLIVWEPDAEREDVVVIRYIGADPFA